MSAQGRAQRRSAALGYAPHCGTRRSDFCAAPDGMKTRWWWVWDG